MKIASYLLTTFLIFCINNITAQDKEPLNNSEQLSNAVVNVYYFHNTRRCATCQTVESVTKETLEKTYPEELKKGLIIFKSLNIEDDENKALAKELDISGQALLLIKEDQRKDLTNEAFMYARSNPDKLKKEIQQFIGDK
jgi:hypothetical protein